jgi:hypothetical protein
MYKTEDRCEMKIMDDLFFSYDYEHQNIEELVEKVQKKLHIESKFFKNSSRW